MKPNDKVRKGKDYCCKHCDGPYAKYKKVNAKRLKQKNKRIVKRQIVKDVNESESE